MRKVQILNCEINNIRLQKLLDELSVGIVVTPNVDHLIMLQKDKDFYTIYQNADWKICDSKIIQFASWFLRTPIIEKISGSDFFPAFCNYHKGNDDVKIFLLGAATGVAQKATDNINRKLRREIIVDYRSPSFGFENNDNECLDIVSQINKSGATVLAIGVGAPKQEKWIYKYRELMPNVKIFMAIGATIDFEAGKIKRAPKMVSNSGLEWLYRLILEPKRLWKRYLVNDLPFLLLILKQKMGLYKNPM